MNAPTHLRLGALALGMILCGAVMTACGGTGSQASTGDTAAAAGPAEPVGGGGPGSRPGASGEVAAIDGRTLQVQNDTDGQVAITVTDATTLTRQVAARRSALQVGPCVRVTPQSSASTEESSGSQVSEGDAVIAATVASSAAQEDGSCSGDMSGMGGGPGGGRGAGEAPEDAQPPSEPPSDLPENGEEGAGGPSRMVRGLSGAITEVSGDTLTLAVQAMARPGSTSGSASGSESGSGPVGAGTSTVTVTLTPRTAYTRTIEASTADLAIGQCVSATGDTDDVGAVSADRIAISRPVDGECDLGFGGGQR
ncbi:DUF5666 domain-containing protein [Nocardioides insulae]|uniref:DUF5666 domain-containing protein n=1 Tax=Nocardioides insulae TaxID=394734 RepID=UPI00041F3465|nr:DUF5666 domain-containing protein [Nocardioides insulae]